jgi:hypothetical protein
MIAGRDIGSKSPGRPLLWVLGGSLWCFRQGIEASKAFHKQYAELFWVEELLEGDVNKP